MSKISTYEVAPVPKLSDKLIGTSVGGEIEDVTYNFTLQELLEVFLPVIPANNLQGILDYGNTATQDINLFGTITTTNLDVTDTANLFITYLNEETHLVGSLFDSADSVGTVGQVLTSTGDGVEWFTLPPIFTPNLEQVLTEGNTSDIDIILDANIEALDVSANTATIAVNLTLDGTITDNNSSVGGSGQVLESTVTGVRWVNLPVYSATSPLYFNPATNTFSIQPANSTQGGYLTANDWITFDGKQNAGSYITALTGEATATGPGSVPITLNNASVIAKVLTGLNVTGGSITASDSILTAFGKVQSQINGLIGGVQYQGTWNASTNSPFLQSSIGVAGHFYIVNVAGNTNLNGITDWKIGDWAIFSGGAWSKVDNTESVTSVNGQIGAVSLTTDDIPEGATNLYYLDSRARGALSFVAGSGAYDSLTGVITIPTNNNQILNGANYITLASLSVSAPLSYDNLTGVFSIAQATALADGYLSATDWSTFNNKQNYLGGTGLVKSTAGTITYITDNSSNWNTAYDNMIVSAAVTGTTTKTLTLTEQDGGTIQASWTDLDTGLTSVGVSMPSAFSVANSPLTANGTIAITGAGTSLQYIDGTGALQNFPGLTGFVPYIGATQNVDLGEYGISAGYFQADLTPTGALQVGRMQWNPTEGTMDLRLMGNNVTLQIGQENVTRVVNKTGVDLLEANYQVVRVRKVAEGGAQGQRLAVVLAQGNNENNSTEVLGLVTETILVNQEGFVTSFGEVKNIDTTGTLQGETWVDGDILYVSTTVPGQLTNIRPVAPNHAVTVGYVTYAHANNGKIYMAIDTGYELGELHNVYAPSPTANQSIYWNTANSRYELNTIAGILGYTPANDSLVVHLAGTETITGAKTFTTKVTINTGGTDDQLQLVGTAPSVRLSNAVSGATINGFIAMAGATNNYIQGAVAGDMTIGNQNNGRILFGFGSGTATSKMSLDASGNVDFAGGITLGGNITKGLYNYTLPSASGTLALTSDLTSFVTAVTASGPLASSGGTTPNITIQQASGSQDGYLSSTDWTTFNNKQASGNYITSLTGEATASGPGAAAVSLNNAAVTGKILTGINITGGTVQATDSILTGFGKLQNQINGLIGSTIYQGTWNASTNTPALASGVGTKGYYYIVSVAGSTNLDGITDWNIGDWAIFDGTAWQQVDNTDSVVSVNGQTGAVSLTTDNIPEGTTNLYFTNTRARDAISLTTVGSSGAATYSGGVLNIPNYGNALSAYVPYTGATGAVNLGPYDLTVNSVVVGKGAGTGGNNVVLGDNALSANTTGSRNVAIGTFPLWKNTTGVGNIAIGAETLINELSGNNNIAIGDNTAKYITTGSSNTIIGPTSDLSGLTTGSYNTILGGALTSLGNISNNIILADGQGNIKYRWDGTNNNLYGNTIFSSTISNGTYTYTLPGATGTLALTSELANYLPLTGGTLSGQLTFSSQGSKITFGDSTSASPMMIGEGLVDTFGVDSDFITIYARSSLRIFSTNTNERARFDANGLRVYGTIIKDGGTSTQFLMADGSVTTGSFGDYLPLAGGTMSGVLTNNSTSLNAIALSGGGSGYNSSAIQFYNANYPSDATKYYTQYGGNWASPGTWGMGVRGTNDSSIYLGRTASGVIETSVAINFYIGPGLALHTSNYSSYALPLTGGTMSGVITGNGSGNFYIYNYSRIGLPNAGRIIYNNGTGSNMFFGEIASDVYGFTGNLYSDTPTLAMNLSSQRVGIGIASPAQKLHVDGAIKANRLGFLFPSYTGNKQWEFASDPNFGDGAYIYANSTGYVQSFFPTGNIGINTTTDAGQRFQVIGTSYFSGIMTIGQLSPNGGANGIYFRPGIESGFIVTSDVALQLSRLGTTGTIQTFYSGTTRVGQIAVTGSAVSLQSSLNGGLSIESTGQAYFSNYLYATRYLIQPNGTGQVYNIVNANSTYAGSYTIQAGEGSSGYGGSFTMWGHSHASRAGYVSAGISAGSNGKFTVMNAAIGAGSDVFTVDVSGNVVANGLITASGGINFASTVRMRWGGNNTPALGFPFGGSDTGNSLFIEAADGDSGGIAINNDGVTVYGAADTGFVFRAIDEDSYQSGVGLAAATTFQVNQGTNGGGYIRGTFNVYSGSVYADAFYESSDRRLKTLIKDNYLVDSISSIKPKLYTKNGKEEVGYFAQDFQEILPTAVSVNDAGDFSLSYTQVHTAKIAVIEDEVTLLKSKVSELEAKLLKYEA